MAESNEHHVTSSISDQTQRYKLPTNPRKNTDNYNGAITLLHERLVFDDEYVDTRIWTEQNVKIDNYTVRRSGRVSHWVSCLITVSIPKYVCTHVTEDLKLYMGQ